MSVGVHIVVLVALWLAQQLVPEPRTYEVVQIQLVSPPPTQSEAPPPVDEPPSVEEELVVETPFEEEPVVDEEAPVVAEEEPEPDPVETPPVEETPPPDLPPAQETAAPDPEPTESTDEGQPSEETTEDSGEDLDVRMEGLRRDYPQYYANIIAQMRRCFRATRPGRAATVSFLIRADGTTAEYTIVNSSGNFGFDLDALSAVECAGKAGRLGPLPEGFPWEVLPVEFTFTEGRSGDAFYPDLEER